MDRVTLGNFELEWFSDGNYYLDGGAMFGVVPRTMWEKRIPPDAMNRVSLGLNSLLIRTGDHTVLVETGIGGKIPEKMQRIWENQAQLLNNLAARGVDPAEIDIVINTHLHFDHCGWNTMLRQGRVVPTFPNARYYAQAGEVEHAHRQLERDRISYMTDNYDPLIASGQMQLLTGDQEIVPGVSVRVYPGHTRNLQTVMIQSNGQTACYVSDLIPTRSHLDLTWVMAYDLFPLECIESRRRFYQQAIPEKWLVFFTHDPDDPWAYVEAGEKGKFISRPV
jgi:glyoxylase-like metal-dependent hydrolase (beta-lactamase superfamily II)